MTTDIFKISPWLIIIIAGQFDNKFIISAIGTCFAYIHWTIDVIEGMNIGFNLLINTCHEINNMTMAENFKALQIKIIGISDICIVVFTMSLFVILGFVYEKNNEL